MPRTGVWALWLVLSALRPSVGAAQFGDGATPAQHRIRYTSLTAVQYNPLGVQTDLWLGYRFRLVNSEKLLWCDTFIGPTAIVRVNPAFTRLGAGLEVQPLAALTLRASYEHRLYYGTFNTLMSFDSPHVDYSEDAIKRLGEQDRNYAGNGAQVILQAVVRAKYGPMVILNDLKMHYFHMDLREGDRVFYVNLLDTLAPDRGWVLSNDAHVLFLTHFNLIFGFRYTLIHALYSEDLLDERGNINTPNHRIGPMVAYVLDDLDERVRAPMVVLIVNWWSENRYRNGQEVAAGIPYLAIAFSFSGDLWSR